MLKITILGEEFYDDRDQTFTKFDDVVLELEHSLVSLSKWESEHQKPFLAPGQKSTEEILSYISCMILTPNIDPKIIGRFTSDNLSVINAYIESKQSATTFSDKQPKGSSEVITSELIYYWMVAANIPFVCETWHLNRLFSLIRVCSIKNSKPKKMSRRELAQRNRELNTQRKAEWGTTG